MHSALPTPDEAARLAALRELALLDTPPEERFDRVVRRAVESFHVPIALVTLVDEDRQWFKSCIGLDVDSTGRDISFCGHAIQHDEVFIVEDALADERFFDNPLVTGDPHIRFYAGRPLHAVGGERVGTLCLIDRQPRTLSDAERSVLDDLAAWVEAELRAGQLQQAVTTFASLEALREQLVSAVSHELRTPLTSVLGSLAVVASGEEGPLSDGQEELLAIAARNARRIEALTDDLLLLASLDADRGDQRAEVVDLGALARDLAEELELAGRAEGRVQVRAEPGVTVRGDAERLRQAVANLVGNALKYSPETATVEVRVAVVDGHARVDVVDQGVGIAPEELSRVGERFFRATSGEKASGTGLGLAITRAIAEQHGGRLEAQSVLGNGSTFSLVLPHRPPRTAVPRDD